MERVWNREEEEEEGRERGYWGLEEGGEELAYSNIKLEK